jgi:AcrR family transcriptional regulator
MTHNAAPDLRVQRTRKALREAMVALTIEKGFAAVTVQDIVGRAVVNRATFYRHYQDKYDLVMSSVEEILDELDVPNTPPPTQFDQAMIDVPSPAEIHVYQHFAQHAPFYRALLGKDGLSSLPAYLRGRIEQILRHHLDAAGYDAERARIPLDLCISFAASSAVGSIIWWLEHDLPYPAEQMAVWLSQLIGYGVDYGMGLDVASVGSKKTEEPHK